jgi:hypothetical protein
MSVNINERIAKEREKLEQLKRLKKAEDAKAKKKQAAIDKDRDELFGNSFLKHFRGFLRVQPHRTAAKNEAIITFLDNYFSELAADERVVQITEKHIAQIKTGNGL